MPFYTLYSRFFIKVLRSGDDHFPELNLFAQGMVTKGGVKMSKSKEMVSPRDIILRYGQIPFGLSFSSRTGYGMVRRGVEGAHRFQPYGEQ